MSRILGEILPALVREPAPLSGESGFVFILGMHRSGTSCLAGCLERCGLHLGPVSRISRSNARGNHELPEVRLLHDEILAASGGTWDKPPSRVKVSSKDRASLRQQAQGLLEHAPCGLKDPRLLLLLDTWESIVQPSIRVGTFRHPLAVAQSLARRNQMPLEKALALWNLYNGELVRRHRQEPFPLVEFDLGQLDAYLDAVISLAAVLKLTPDVHAMRAFVAAELDHASGSDTHVPEQCVELYTYLRRHAWRGSTS